MDSSDRDSEPMGPRAVELDGGPDEAAYEEARVTDLPARISDSSDRSSNARPASALDTSDSVWGASCMYDFDGGRHWSDGSSGMGAICMAYLGRDWYRRDVHSCGSRDY